jgi:hypothetical protein
LDAAAAAAAAAATDVRHRTFFIISGDSACPELMGSYMSTSSDCVSKSPWRQLDGRGVAYLCPKGFIRIYACEADAKDGRGRGVLCTKEATILWRDEPAVWCLNDHEYGGWLRRYGLIWMKSDARVTGGQWRSIWERVLERICIEGDHTERLDMYM